MEDVKLSVDQSTAIIAEAKNDGVFTDPMPVDERERVDEATKLYQKALDAARSGVKAQVVHNIIAIAEGGLPPFETEEQQESEPDEPPVETESKDQEVENDLDFVLYEKPVEEKPKPARKSAKPKAAKLPIDDFLAKERLPIPPEADWDITPLPADLTSLSDVEVRRLHGEYHAYFSRAAWLLVQEENDLSAAEHLHNIALARAIKEIGGDKITAAKNEAASDAEVVKWKEKMLEHGANAKKLKTLVSIYDSTCNRLSREWTMRSDERGTSGNLFNNR